MQWNLEPIILLSSIVSATLVSLFVMRYSWRHYGLLYVLSSLFAVAYCVTFVYLKFYRFPYTLVGTRFPILILLSVLPALVLVAVRYSPQEWKWKIPYYWALVHVVMFTETVLHELTMLIHYEFQWDTWDSYTWWWVYFLIFELIGSLVVPAAYRKPLNGEGFRYGRPLWVIFHFIVVTTIFLAGVYVGRTLE